MEVSETKFSSCFQSNTADEPSVGTVAGHRSQRGTIDNSAEEGHRNEPRSEDHNRLLYTIEDTPRWGTCIILGLQHCFLAIGGLIGMPLVIAPYMCVPDNEDGYVSTAKIINSLFFVAGIVTLLQTTVGTRLPILQGGSFAYLPCILAVLSLPQNQCPAGPINPNITNGSFLYNDTDGSIVDGSELWQRRMRQIQGSIAVASIFELIFGITGAVGWLMRFIGPLTIASSVCLVGLSLYEAASSNASGQWGIAIFTVAVLIIFSEYLGHTKCPVPSYSRRKGCHVAWTNFFKLFATLIAIAAAWILCLILTETGVWPDNVGEYGYRARTDAKIDVLYSSPWFYFPYPGQWGLPVVSGAAVAGMIAAVLAGMIESIGAYYACARLVDAPPVPDHAINRGLTVEGFGCVLAGVVGTGTGLVSYTENIGAIGITRVGSRRVLQAAGATFFLLGMFGKFGAVLVLIPDPIIGGLFCVVFGMIASVGLSSLQFVDLNSSRNLFILGFSLFMGMMVPIWMKENPGAIQTGVEELDQVFDVLLETSVFVGGVLSAFLDNTIPGTRAERGFDLWNKDHHQGAVDKVGNLNKRHTSLDNRVAECYNLPFPSSCCRFSKYIPILPEFESGKYVSHKTAL